MHMCYYGALLAKRPRMEDYGVAIRRSKVLNIYEYPPVAWQFRLFVLGIPVLTQRLVVRLVRAVSFQST